MTDKTDKKLNKWDTIIKIATALLVMVVIVLQSNYATKDEIYEIKVDIAKITTSVALLAEQQKQDDRQDKSIEALETKVQELEVNMATIK